MNDLEKRMYQAEQNLEQKVHNVENREQIEFSQGLSELEKEGTDKGIEEHNQNILDAQENIDFVEAKKNEILEKYKNNEKVQEYLKTEEGQKEILGAFTKEQEDNQHKIDYYKESNPELVKINEKIDAMIFEDEKKYSEELGRNLNILKRASFLNESAFEFRKNDIHNIIKNVEEMLLEKYEELNSSEISQKIKAFEESIGAKVQELKNKQEDDTQIVPETAYMDLEKEITSMTEEFETQEVKDFKETESKYKMIINGIEKSKNDMDRSKDTHNPRAELQSSADIYNKNFEQVEVVE